MHIASPVAVASGTNSATPQAKPSFDDSSIESASGQSTTLTFLVTDIEQSTRRWEEQPAGMREALAHHDAILKVSVESHGGWLFKHTGDGVLAAFSRARSAVEAAIDAQRKLGLPVRMGVCTGEVEARSGDYFGPPLNRAARIMAAAHAGQIVIAEATAAMIDRISLVELGEHSLRDISGPIRLYQVRAKGLRQNFPPLNSLNAAAARWSGFGRAERSRFAAERETPWETHVAKASERVLRGKAAVARQEETIKRLRASGGCTEDADRLLLSFQRTLAALEQHQRSLLAEQHSSTRRR